jgi:signal transduction histidine kinase
MHLRFISFFVGGLFLFILIYGLFVALFIEFPIIRFAEDSGSETLYILTVTFVPFILAGAILGQYFVSPLTFMVSLVRQLSSGDYDLSNVQNKLYKHNGKLKKRYNLYKELLYDLNILSENLIQTEKQRIQLEEAKTNWITGVSHDLKTPLSYITGYSNLLLSRKDWSNEEQEDFLHKIKTKSEYIESLIGDLNLSFKLESMETTFPLNLEEFNLIDFARRLMADILNTPQANLYEIGYMADEEHIMIKADKKLLSRAIQNIVMNAINHNPEGTEINLRIQRDLTKGTIEISITDNGKGIDENALKNIFSRYNSTEEYKDNNASGGLGLSIVKSIVKAHKGEILIESELGKGTMVKIVFFK